MTTKSDYYCSQKFWWLSANIEKLTTQSCCAADTHKINIDWLDNNPGKLFNTLELQNERQTMLDNIPVASCKSSCWIPEERGLGSRRLIMGSEAKTHTDIESTPEFLNIIVGSHCNMTCVYCCKQYSSAWLNDIFNNGIYPVTDVGDRYTVNNKDRAVAAVSQKEINISPNKIKLFDELGKISDIKKLSTVTISGGEPFLYLYLDDLIEKFPETVSVSIFTGLGIDEKRFAKELDKLIKYPNVNLVISAENINKNYEVVRAGNTWQRFETNLLEIQKHNIKYSFNSVLSNLTLFGLIDFINYVGGIDINFEICNTPNFLSMHVMDDKSKETIYNNIDKLPMAVQLMIKNSLSIESEIIEQRNLKAYLTEFTKRRNLSLDSFPTTFIDWINHVV
jgi:organic radical activating enzyme